MLSLFILVTFFSQISMQFKDNYVTETAVTYSSAEKVSFQGVYIRNESVIRGSASGVLSYPNADGSKIANGSVVAYVYKSENDIYVNHRIEQLKEEVSLLESAQNPGITEVAKPTFISSLIDDEYQTIAVLIAKNDLETLSKERKQLQTLMDIYHIVIDEETDFNDAISGLNSEISDLERQRRNYTDVITADSTGYFVSHTDGYENILSLDDIGNLTADKIREVISEPQKESSAYDVGKMVDGYEWKMAGLIDPKAADFKVGSSVTVKFASTPDTVTAVIDDIIETDDPDENIIIISCDELTFDLVQRRVDRVEIILNDYEGIKVPREAIRFDKNNEKGVYILLGQRISFRKIDPVYECDEYILSKITSDTSYVSMYDDIITKGEISADLYVEETTVAPEDDSPEDDVSDVSGTSYENTESVTEQESGTDAETEDNADNSGSSDEEYDDDTIWETE